MAADFKRVLCSKAAGLHAKAVFKRDFFDAGREELVAFARPLHLPASPFARAADPHAT
jgi:hypothetical protein